MSNPKPDVDAKSTMTPRKTSSLNKLIQAAALAVILIPLGSVAVETATVTCGISYFGEGGFEGEGCSNLDQNRSRFDFGDYFLELAFDLDPAPPFTVTVTTTEDTEFVEGKAALHFPGYECIPITTDDITGEPQCVDFHIASTGEFETHWSHYEIEVNWQTVFGPLDADLMTLLHDAGGSPLREYDNDVCGTERHWTVFPYGDYDPCTVDVNPLIRSGDSDFQSFAAFQQHAVPEPTALTLLGLGLGGALLRRRRRN